VTKKEREVKGEKEGKKRKLVTANMCDYNQPHSMFF
jgi:hypothetical protein